MACIWEFASYTNKSLAAAAPEVDDEATGGIDV
jgi:hypothetical protein